MSDYSKKRLRTSPTGDTPKQAGKVSRIPKRVSPARSAAVTIASASISKTPTSTEPRHCGTSFSRIPMPCEHPLKGRKKLSFGEEVVGSVPPVSVPHSWSEEEEKALVEFVVLSTNGKSWPATKSERFWDSAATFVSQRCCVHHRTGKLSLVTMWLYLFWGGLAKVLTVT